MVEFFTGAPWWVYAVLAYLAFFGFKCTKDRSAPLPVFFIFPLLFIGLQKYTLYKHGQMCCFIPWSAALIIGSGIGWWLGSKTPIQIDKVKKSVLVPGSWRLFIILMITYVIWYCFGYMHHVHPNVICPYFPIEMGLYAIMSGILLGQALNYTYRYIKAS